MVMQRKTNIQLKLYAMLTAWLKMAACYLSDSPSALNYYVKSELSCYQGFLGKKSCCKIIVNLSEDYAAIFVFSKYCYSWTMIQLKLQSAGTYLFDAYVDIKSTALNGNYIPINPSRALLVHTKPV